jgi:hypothetical protein
MGRRERRIGCLILKELFLDRGAGRRTRLLDAARADVERDGRAARRVGSGRRLVLDHHTVERWVVYVDALGRGQQVGRTYRVGGIRRRLSRVIGNHDALAGGARHRTRAG